MSCTSPASSSSPSPLGMAPACPRHGDVGSSWTPQLASAAEEEKLVSLAVAVLGLRNLGTVGGHAERARRRRREGAPPEGLGIPGRGPRQGAEAEWRARACLWSPRVPGKGGYLSLYQSAVAIMGHVTNSPTILMPFNSFIVYFLLSSLWVCWGSADPVWE